jgi:hypothetical protein
MPCLSVWCSRAANSSCDHDGEQHPEGVDEHMPRAACALFAGIVPRGPPPLPLTSSLVLRKSCMVFAVPSRVTQLVDWLHAF